ncbi:MAG: hypothetical protein KKA07_10090 [Bacteroidetes bacterium]|nr:hypothetical protein [Bacteroidota bacterium]
MKTRYSFRFALLLSVMIYCSTDIFAQSVCISGDGSAPDSKSMLDIKATGQGLLIPRMTWANRPTAIGASQNGLLIYSTDGDGVNGAGFYYWNGSVWAKVGSGAAGWALTGNSGTTAGTNFLGTTDAIDMVIKTNNTEKMRIQSAGNVGIGTASPNEKLEINGSVRGNQSGALRISTGSGYVDVGPKNASWSHFYTDRPRYWFSAGVTVESGEIGSYDEDLSLQTAGTTRITTLNSNGNVGINVSPTHKLHVVSTETTGSAIYAYLNQTTNGTSWTAARAALYGYGATSTSQYQAGILGYQAGTGNNSAGVVGVYSSSIWGGLGYSDNSGNRWAGYFNGPINVEGGISLWSAAPTTTDGIASIVNGANVACFSLWGLNNCPTSDGTGYGNATANIAVSGQMESQRQYSFGLHAMVTSCDASPATLPIHSAGVYGTYTNSASTMQSSGALGYKDGSSRFFGVFGQSQSAANYFAAGFEYNVLFPSVSSDWEMRPNATNYGYVGTSSYVYYYMYCNNFIDPSSKDKKRGITYVSEDPRAEDYVMADIDKLRPAFYKYNFETDEMVKGNERKYRPNSHLGVILEDAPDYIQDNDFSGIDIYSLATLSLVGVKHNRTEILELKQDRMDYGSVEILGNEVSVNFSTDFGNAVPVISLTCIGKNANVYIMRKDSNGFVIYTDQPGVTIDWHAFAKAPAEKKADIQPPIEGLKVPAEKKIPIVLPDNYDPNRKDTYKPAKKLTSIVPK